MSSSSVFHNDKVNKRPSVGTLQLEYVRDEASSEDGLPGMVTTSDDLIAEEKALVRKIDTFLLPTIFIM